MWGKKEKRKRRTETKKKRKMDSNWGCWEHVARKSDGEREQEEYEKKGPYLH